MDSLRSSEFLVATRRRSSVSSFVQVLGMALGSEGSPTVSSVVDMGIGLDCSDGSLYLPR